MKTLKKMHNVIGIGSFSWYVTVVQIGETRILSYQYVTVTIVGNQNCILWPYSRWTSSLNTSVILKRHVHPCEEDFLIRLGRWWILRLGTFLLTSSLVRNRVVKCPTCIALAFINPSTTVNETWARPFYRFVEIHYNFADIDNLIIIIIVSI